MNSSPTGPSDDDIVREVKARAGFDPSKGGPTEKHIVDGVRGFAREFEYWYNRVLEEALPKYQTLIVDRINPMIRGMQLEGLSAPDVAARLVADYAHRNYVTAGGWALEQLAIAASPRLQKSSAAGIDAEWHEPGPPPSVHLYVIKSGKVTRNSDILKVLKLHGQEAQKRLLQTDKRSSVRVNYVVTAGAKSSTYHDGVFRPSSAEFWAEAFALDGRENDAIDLALAMAQEAGALLRSFTDLSAMSALQSAVCAHIAQENDPSSVDWEYLARRNMIASKDAKKEASRRHEAAKKAVQAIGHTWPSKSRGKTKNDLIGVALAEAAAEVSPEAQDLMRMVLPQES